MANDTSVPETDRTAIIGARKGQGLFKERVSEIEFRCRIAGDEISAGTGLMSTTCRNLRAKRCRSATSASWCFHTVSILTTT
jgi:hypothetical protein